MTRIAKYLLVAMFAIAPVASSLAATPQVHSNSAPVFYYGDDYSEAYQDAMSSLMIALADYNRAITECKASLRKRLPVTAADLSFLTLDEFRSSIQFLSTGQLIDCTQSQEQAYALSMINLLDFYASDPEKTPAALKPPYLHLTSPAYLNARHAFSKLPKAEQQKLLKAMFLLAVVEA